MAFTPPALQEVGFDKTGGATGPQGDPGVVQEIVAGTNVSVDNTDPAYPIVSATGGGGVSDWGDITGTLSDQTDLQTALDGKVSDTGNETIAGVKTFSSSPVVPTPTTDYQAATKKYVDDNAGGGGGGTSLSPSYHKTDQADDTTVYSGINDTSDLESDSNWSINKIVTTTDPERSRTVYTATGVWENRYSLVYSTSITYSL